MYAAPTREVPKHHSRIKPDGRTVFLDYIAIEQQYGLNDVWVEVGHREVKRFYLPATAESKAIADSMETVF